MSWNDGILKRKGAAAAEAPLWEYSCGADSRRVARKGVNQVARHSRAHPTTAAAATAAAPGGRGESRYGGNRETMENMSAHFTRCRTAAKPCALYRGAKLCAI